MQVVKRGKNFSLDEKETFLRIMSKYSDNIENKETNKTSKVTKDKAWAQITLEFNQLNDRPRSKHNLQCCWDNLKTKCKEYSAQLHRSLYKTGGGKADTVENPLLEKVKTIIGHKRVEGLSNKYDSDAIINNENKENISISVIESDSDNSDEVFAYLKESNQIDIWDSYNPDMLKSEVSPPLQNIINKAKKSFNKDEKTTGKSIHQEIKGMDTASVNSLKSSEEEKRSYEIELLKVKIEKEKLNVEINKIILEKEKAMKKIIDQKLACTEKDNF